MLSKYMALKQKVEAKKQARKEALEAIDAEFGDAQAEFDEERAKILAFMKSENMMMHIVDEGIIEVRNSREKYVVKDEQALLNWLFEHKAFDALSYKKEKVNVIKKTEDLPDNIVAIEREDELVIRELK